MPLPMARAAGAEVDIRRVAETAPAAVVQAAGFKTDTAHPVLADPNELANYDAIVVGTPTRFGRMSSQMASFWDTAGGVWAQAQAERVGRRSLRLDRFAARRTGNHPVLGPDQSPALRHDDCRTRLWLRRPDGRR
jgi:multimeric flavodoxin WrbA